MTVLQLSDGPDGIAFNRNGVQNLFGGPHGLRTPHGAR